MKMEIKGKRIGVAKRRERIGGGGDGGEAVRKESSGCLFHRLVGVNSNAHCWPLERCCNNCDRLNQIHKNRFLLVDIALNKSAAIEIARRVTSSCHPKKKAQTRYFIKYLSFFLSFSHYPYKLSLNSYFIFSEKFVIKENSLISYS